MNFRFLVLIGMLCICGYACVEPFSVVFSTPKEYIVVDGVVTDSVDPQFILLSKTNPDSKNASSEFSQTIWTKGNSTLPLIRAKAKVIVNETQTFELTEDEPGSYRLPLNFKGKVGDSYKIHFVTENGNTYESAPEKMLPVTPIKSAYDVYSPKGIHRTTPFYGEYLPTNDVYIDFDDTPVEKNFYRWQWTLWEIQKMCSTCNQGKYYLFDDKNGVNGDCFKDLTLNYNNIYDYYCEDLCWDIFYSSDINIFADTYTNGLSQKDKLVAQIPVHQSNPCLVSLQQQSLTPAAYRFLKLLQDQSVNTGTLADTPPAPIQGNVVNVNNKNELVIGFFTASSVSEYRTMLWRKNTKNVAALNQLFKTIRNRDPIIEEKSPERPYIPLAQCKNSKARTPFLPRDWKWTQ